MVISPVIAPVMDFNRAAQVAIAWADAQGWNPGLDDAERFLAADPDSFLATEPEGEIVATVSCALYGDSYAFIGSERERFLRLWIDRPAGHALACLDGGRLAGYGWCPAAWAPSSGLCSQTTRMWRRRS